jgi:hypothetical protein
MRASSRAAVALAVVVASEEPVVRVGLVELAGPVVREGLAELVVQAVREVLVELAVLAGLVVREALAELELRPGKARLAQEIALAEPGAGRVAAPPKTKSVIEPHRHGQVRVPKKVAALAAAAETTPEQVAAEAAKAWVVVG